MSDKKYEALLSIQIQIAQNRGSCWGSTWEKFHPVNSQMVKSKSILRRSVRG